MIAASDGGVCAPRKQVWKETIPPKNSRSGSARTYPFHRSECASGFPRSTRCQIEGGKVKMRFPSLFGRATPECAGNRCIATLRDTSGTSTRLYPTPGKKTEELENREESGSE